MAQGILVALHYARVPSPLLIAARWLDAADVCIASNQDRGQAGQSGVGVGRHPPLTHPGVHRVFHVVAEQIDPNGP